MSHDERREDDALVRELRALPELASPPAQVRDAARAAFVRAFDAAPCYERILSAAGRQAVPLVLASVVGLYLFWAFATAIALAH
jgi:hypothetical protein